MEFMDSVKMQIPTALYDKYATFIRDNPSILLACLSELVRTWEEVNGKDLVWIPGHYEKKKPEKNFTAEDISRILQDSTPDIYARGDISTSTSDLE